MKEKSCYYNNETDEKIFKFKNKYFNGFSVVSGIIGIRIDLKQRNSVQRHRKSCTYGKNNQKFKKNILQINSDFCGFS